MVVNSYVYLMRLRGSLGLVGDRAIAFGPQDEIEKRIRALPPYEQLSHYILGAGSSSEPRRSTCLHHCDALSIPD